MLFLQVKHHVSNDHGTIKRKNPSIQAVAGAAV